MLVNGLRGSPSHLDLSRYSEMLLGHYNQGAHHVCTSRVRASEARQHRCVYPAAGTASHSHAGRKQKGFQDEITFVVPAGTEAFGVSLWDNKESADAYNRGPYAEVTEILANLVDGNSQVDTYEVSNSTFHKIGAAARP
jgi:hypothetical protein